MPRARNASGGSWGVQVLRVLGVAFRAQRLGNRRSPNMISEGHALFGAVSAHADGAGGTPRAPVTCLGILQSLNTKIF